MILSPRACLTRAFHQRRGPLKHGLRQQPTLRTRSWCLGRAYHSSISLFEFAKRNFTMSLNLLYVLFCLGTQNNKQPQGDAFPWTLLPGLGRLGNQEAVHGEGVLCVAFVLRNVFAFHWATWDLAAWFGVSGCSWETSLPVPHGRVGQWAAMCCRDECSPRRSQSSWCVQVASWWKKIMWC